MRIRGAKTELEEAGLETEGMVESTAKLRSEILALSGVDIMKNANEFKSTYAIMDELAAKWENLTDIQQASVTELIAGKRQGNIVSSLMTNFNTARDALETSLNSSGSAMREHEKWQQSLEAQINKLKASWQSLSQAFLQSDFLKFAFDRIIGLVDGVTKLIDTFGTAQTLIGGFAAFKGISRILSVSKELGGLKVLADILPMLSVAFPNAAKGMGIFSAALKGGVGIVGILKAALSGLWTVVAAHPILAIVSAVGLAIAAFVKWGNQAEELAKKVEEATSKFKEQHGELTKGKSSFESEAKRYAQLSKGVGQLGENISLTADEYSEYKELVNSIGNQVPSLIKGYDAEGNAILGVKNNVDKLIQSYKDLIITANNELLYKGTDKTDGADVFKDFQNKQADTDKTGFWDSLFGNDKDLTNVGYNALQDVLEAMSNGDDISKAVDKYIKTGTVSMVEIANKLRESDVKQKKGESGSDFIKRAFVENKQVIDAMMSDYKTTVESNMSGLRDVTKAYFSNAFLTDYDDVSDFGQNIINQMLPNLDADFYQSFDSYEDMIARFRTMLDSIKNLDSGTSKEIETAFNLQTKFNSGDISYGEYVNGVENVVDLVNNSSLDEEIKSQIKLSLDINEDGLVEEYQTLLKRLTEIDKNKISTGNIIGFELEEAKEFLDSLSSDKLSLVNDAIKDFKPISADEIKAEFDKFEEGGSVDLTLRPQVDTSVLKKAGWENAGEGAATVFTSTFSNAAKDIAMNFTPIVVDKDGKHIDTLSPKALQEYAEGVIAGTRKDDLNLQIGAKFEGEDAIAQAASAAERIHQLQDYYYNGTSAQLQAVIDRMMAVQGLTFDLNLEVETAGIEALNTAMAESVSGAGLSAESIAALKDRYKDLESEGYNLSAMFEETSNGIHINREAFRELEKAYAQGKQAEITEDLTALKKEYDLVTQEIESCNDASERASLYVQRDAILQQINDAATLASQYEGLTSAYNDWLAAEEAGQERDMYEKLIEGFENVDDEISRGWLDDGTIEFLELLSGKDLTAAPIKELKEAYKDLDKTIGNSKYSVRDFFTVNEDGDSTNTGVYNFLETIESFDKFKDVIKKKDGRITGFNFEVVAEKDEKGNVIKNGDQVIAEALGIREELVQIMLRAADDAGFVINLEGAYTQLADLKTEAEAARDSLISLKNSGLKELKDTDVNFNLNAEGQDLVDEQAKAIELLKKFRKDDGVINLEMTGAQEALDIAEYLTLRLDDLTEPRFMQVDASTLAEELQTPFEKMQKIGELLKEKNLETLIGDPKVIAETESEITTIAEELAGLPDETKTKIGIEKDWTSDEIVDAIEKGEIEIPAELKLDVQMSDDLKDMRLMMMNQLGLVSDDEVKLKVGFDIDESIVNELTEEEKQVVIRYVAENEEEFKKLTDGEKKAVIKIIADGTDVESWEPEQKEALVKYIVDGGSVENWTPEQKLAFAKYLVDGGDVTNWSPEAKNAFVKYLVDGGDPEKFDPENKESWVVYKVDDTEPVAYEPPAKEMSIWARFKGWLNEFSNDYAVSEVNGTANVNGTTGRAFKQGSWGTQNSGTALVGELGREVLVRDGKYYTIGDSGAEFIKYKKGDIIFNHVQSEQLFRNGKVTASGGRAKALFNGTAFAQGTAFVGGSGGTDGGLGKITEDVSAIRKETEKGSGSKGSDSDGEKNKDGKAVGDKSKSGSSSSSEKEFEETFDWIEIAISRIERAIDKLDQKANNVYKSWSSRNSALTKEIGKVQDEIELQEKAYDRYIKEANSVGLSSSWKKKVQNGTVDISTIKDEGLAEKIKDYQTWYNKALDCKDAIEELKERESKLYAQRFENVQAQYDGILQGYEHTETMLNEYISQAEEQGHIASKKYYTALINNEEGNISQLKKEQSALIAERDKAVADGKITKYSEEWYLIMPTYLAINM